MSIEVLYWCLVVLMGLGIIGAFLPTLPGTSLILIAIVIWGIVKGFSTVSIALVVAVVVLLLSIFVDVLATYWGAKYVGASKWGQIGAVVGLILGILGFLPALPFGGPLLGILFGPLLGAMVGEFLYCRDLKVAIKSSVGIIVGSLLGNVIQGLLALMTVAVFLMTT
jgi:uncharacterized protein